MINGIISVLVVFLLMGTGFYFTRTKKWIQGTSQIFSTVVVQIAAPALALVSIENRFTPALLKSSLWNLLIVACVMLLMHFLGRLLGNLMNLPKKKKAVFTTTFTFNNSMFIGLPIISIICMVWFFALFISAQAARALIPSIEVSDQIFPTIVLTYCGKYLAGILMCAPFAAVMSTVSSLTMVCSSALIKDIYQRTAKEEASADKLKKITYIATFVIALIVVILSVNPPAFLQDIVMLAINGFAGSFTIPILFGFFWKDSTPKGGLYSMIAGFLTIAGLYLLPIPTNLLGFNPLIWAYIVSSLVMVAVSKCTPKQDEAFLSELFK